MVSRLRSFALRLLGVNDRDLEIRQQLRRTGVLLYEIDLTTRQFIHLSGPVKQMTGWDEATLAANRRDLIHPQDRDSYWVDPASVVKARAVDRTARLLCGDGTYMWLRDIAQVEVIDGRPIMRGLSIDVTAIQAELVGMRRRATVDALTGVGNRFALLDELGERLDDSRFGAHDFALFMLDLNRLKEVNDRFGHAFGDAALRQFAARVSVTLRPGDMVARLGGDEFAVVAAGVSTVDEIRQVAERIASCTEAPFVHENVEFHNAVAIGAVLSDPTLTADELLSAADQCMYASKRTGRAYVVASADGEIGGFSLKVEIQEALLDGQFELLYQPKVSLESGAIVGFEGLSRWMHPSLGMLGPAEFIHLLGETETARIHADHVIEDGVAFAGRIADEGLEANVAINVSALALFDVTLAMRIRKVLTTHNVAASSITLEVTESDIMEDVTDPRATLEDLARLGLRVSIDDFGTGYSSLARLRDLPVTEIKIDRRFVANMVDNASDRVIVQSVCDLGRNLDLTVVAEGVENESQVEGLREIGCAVGQGFHFGEPLKADAAIAALRDSQGAARPDLSVVREREEPTQRSEGA